MCLVLKITKIALCIISYAVETHLEQITLFGLLDEVFRILDVGNEENVIIALKIVAKILFSLQILELEKRIPILTKFQELDSLPVLQTLQLSPHAEIRLKANLAFAKLIIYF